MGLVRPNAGTFVGALTVAIGAVGTLKSAIQILSGKSLEPQQVAFYVGASAVAVYIAAMAALVVIAALGGGLAWLNHGDLPNSLSIGLVVVGLVVGVVLAATVVLAGVLVDYNGTDQVGRVSVAAIGVAAIAGGIYLYQRYKPKA